MVSKPFCQPSIITMMIWLFWQFAIAIGPFIVEIDDRGDFYTRQTARVAVFFWGIAVSLMILDRPKKLIRWIWTLAFIAFAIHVAIAFQWAHQWSHAMAFDHVEEVSGFGPGVFVSYAFTVIWGIDVGRQWLTNRYCEAKYPLAIMHAFMATIMFCGTVVYEEGFIRWSGLCMFTMLLVLLINRLRRNDVMASRTS